MKKNSIYKFLAFILNERHANRVIISHYGSRYDQIHILRGLVALGVEFTCLSQGLGVLTIKIPSLGIVFLDSWKFLLEPLAALPKRFDLEEEDEKGLFCFKYNRVEHWGLIKQSPPPLSFYINEFKDSPKTKLDKFLCSLGKCPSSLK